MAVLTGYMAFILASLLVGSRLVLLWRRTREWPELTIGASFLLGGAVGYMAWLAMAILVMNDASAGTIKGVTTFGLAIVTLGALGTAIGTAMIFRAGQLWAKLLVVGFGLAMCVGVGRYAMMGTELGSMTFWWTLVIDGLVYVWAAFETFSLGSTLKKRARLGMADPVVVSRTMKWGICNAMVVASISLSFTTRLIYGIVQPEWASMASSGLLMIAAGAIWLGFFPPTAYRARLERAQESN